MDLHELSKALGLDESDVLDLVDLFLDTCQNDALKVENVIASGDHQMVADAAHSIKGASGNMRFENIYALAQHIENDDRANDLSRAAEQLADIRKELEKIAADRNSFQT